MQVSLEVNPGSYAIHAYEPGQVTINLPAGMTAPAVEHDNQDIFNNAATGREVLSSSVIISPGRLIRNWPPQSFEELQQDHFKQLSDLEPEIVLFGSGETLRWPEPALLAPLINQRIGIEIMDTGAACRTYNILMSDGRNFAAALLLK
jgi:uncharacterized protein